MRIHNIEIYGSKQIRAFIQYLEAVASDREKQEESEKKWQNQALAPGIIGSALHYPPYGAGAYTPEGLARAVAEKQAADLASQKTNLE